MSNTPNTFIVLCTKFLSRILQYWTKTLRCISPPDRKSNKQQQRRLLWRDISSALVSSLPLPLFDVARSSLVTLLLCRAVPRRGGGTLRFVQSLSPSCSRDFQYKPREKNHIFPSTRYNEEVIADFQSENYSV